MWNRNKKDSMTGIVKGQDSKTDVLILETKFLQVMVQLQRFFQKWDRLMKSLLYSLI